jgi:hypothetical protein
MKLNSKVLIGPLLLLMLSSCATQPVSGGHGAPGFWLGLFHGFIAPLSLVWHLLDPTVRMYAFPNSGGWYDFGFFLSIGMLGGGASRSAR